VQGPRAAFPDLQFVIEDEVADSDKVAVRWTAHGTHRSEFNGVQATGRRVRYGGMDLVHPRDGRIVELCAYADGAALMEQLAR
jgi:steroid delta-isomerase-like uncharacterized protein